MKRHYCTTLGCGKSFSRPSHLQRHALNHSTAQWGCSRCTATFKRPDLLERHTARHAAKDKGAGGTGLGLLATKTNILKRDMALEQPQESPCSEEAPANNSRRVHEAPAHNSHCLVGQSRRQARPLEADAVVLSDDSCTGRTSLISRPDTTETESMCHDCTPDAVQTNVGELPNRSSSFSRTGGCPISHDTTTELPGISAANCGRSRTQYPHGPSYSPLSPQQASPATETPDASSSSSSRIASVADSQSTVPRSSNTSTRTILIPPQKQNELVDLITEICPALPNGSPIGADPPDGLTADRMQTYLSLFFENFNTSYPLVHLPSLDICNLDPIVLLSFIIMGATYRDKEAHQLSVCMYDAIIPYIFSGLLSSMVPDLAILQAFMVLECYGMYRAGPHQRENAMLIHSLLLNSIIRVSRYHVRACITLPSRLTHMGKDWLEFSYAEQYKRLIMFFFMWDTQNAACYSIMPNISTQSLHLGLPCSRKEWEAASETEWGQSATKIQAEVGEDSCTFLSLVEVFLDSTYREMPRAYEMLDFSLALHGLVSICNDLIRFDRRSQDFTMLRTQQSGWSTSREQMAYALSSWKAKYEAYTMDAVRDTAETTSPSSAGHDEDRSTSQFTRDNSGLYALYHTAHIVLNCEIRHLQIAAGATALFGHRITHTDYEESCTWVRTWLRDSADSASRAAWHAAQLFREGMLSTNIWDGNRIFHYPWCLYIATLTCWAYHRFGAEMASAGNDGSQRTTARGIEDGASATTTSRRLCNSRTCPAQTEALRRRSRPSMHHLVATMASVTPAYMNTLMGRCCTPWPDHRNDKVSPKHPLDSCI